MRAIERTIRILEILAGAEQGIRLADVCRLSGLDGSTALRYLNALLGLGYASVSVTDKSRYRTGYRLARLSGSSELTLLQQVARLHMEALRDLCGEDVNLGTLDAGAALCLETQKSSHILGANFASGLRVPAHASSLGKAILAFLPDSSRKSTIASIRYERFTPNTITDAARLEAELQVVRQRGYSTDLEEFTPGVVCIGAPVQNMRGRVVAALSITAPVQRISLGDLAEKYSEPLRDACLAVSRALGCSTPGLSAS